MFSKFWAHRTSNNILEKKIKERATITHKNVLWCFLHISRPRDKRYQNFFPFFVSQRRISLRCSLVWWRLVIFHRFGYAYIFDVVPDYVTQEIFKENTQGTHSGFWDCLFFIARLWSASWWQKEEEKKGPAPLSPTDAYFRRVHYTDNGHRLKGMENNARYRVSHFTRRTDSNLHLHANVFFFFKKKVPLPAHGSFFKKFSPLWFFPFRNENKQQSIGKTTVECALFCQWQTRWCALREWRVR